MAPTGTLKMSLKQRRMGNRLNIAKLQTFAAPILLAVPNQQCFRHDLEVLCRRERVREGRRRRSLGLAHLIYVF